jgi:hypothetical protein
VSAGGSGSLRTGNFGAPIGIPVACSVAIVRVRLRIIIHRDPDAYHFSRSIAGEFLDQYHPR